MAHEWDEVDYRRQGRRPYQPGEVKLEFLQFDHNPQCERYERSLDYELDAKADY